MRFDGDGAPRWSSGLQRIAVALLIGSPIGIPMALFMPMTAMPQRIALPHAFGALAAALVGTARYPLEAPAIAPFTQSALGLEVLLKIVEML